MSRRKLLVIAIPILLVFSVLCVGVVVPIGSLAARTDPRPDGPPYAVRGPYPVGVSNLESGGEVPLGMTMWYPALNAEGLRARTKYAYGVKIGKPLGAITLATYAGRAMRDASYDLSAGPYPLVILSPGFAMTASTYGWLAEHLASYGFVVLAPEHEEQFDGELNGLWQTAVTRPQDILTVLAYVDESVDSGRALEGLVDADTVAVIGHSYGGYTALAAGGGQINTPGFEAQCENAYRTNGPIVWLCDQLLPHMVDMAELAGLDSIPEGLWNQAWFDPRVDAIVPMAGDAYLFDQAGLAEIAVPVMAIGGTLDGDTPYMWGTYPTYEYASSPTKVRIGLTGAEHMIFTGPCEASPLLLRLVSKELCADPGWDRSYAHDLISHFTTAFLLDTLKGDQSAHQVLLPDATQFAGIEYSATFKQ